MWVSSATKVKTLRKRLDNYPGQLIHKEGGHGLDDDEKTKDTITDSGWLKSGDLGQVDEAGFFRITGRAKEILITAGGETFFRENVIKEF